VLLDQLEAVLRWDDVAARTTTLLLAAELVAAHARDVLRLDAAPGTAKQLANLVVPSRASKASKRR
jgi:hypothetical protein